MRPLFSSLALAAVLAVPMAAQGARFIKVDIVGKSVMTCSKAKHHEGPTEVHMRVPISLAKSILEMAGDSDIKINGETKKAIKPDALIKLLENSKPGDLLLELTTNKGDLVKIVVE